MNSSGPKRGNNMMRLLTQKIKNVDTGFDLIRITKCPICNVPIRIIPGRISPCSVCFEDIDGSEMITIATSTYSRIKWHIVEDNK